MSGPRYAEAARGVFGDAQQRETLTPPMEERAILADKKTRARAALVCSVIANAEIPRDSTNFVAYTLGLADHDVVAALASEAWISVVCSGEARRVRKRGVRRVDDMNERETWAAAAQLIRDGGP